MNAGSHLLVVEDDEDLRACLTVVLEEEGYQVARVEAIARAARDSLESLPPLRRSEPEDQRAVERLHVLVTVTVEFAEEALAEAEKQLALLGERTARRGPGEGR